MANDEVLGPRKTMFVLVIVVGCFAVLWPRILSPLILGSTSEQLKPNKFDREAGCCEVIFGTEVAVLEFVNEVCGSAGGDRKFIESAAECRKALNDTCGLDIAAFVKRNENVGKTTKLLVETLKNSNSSCLRTNFGVPVYSLSTHFAVNSWQEKEMVKQERPPIRVGPHPALRERGRAIPPGAPSKPVALPPHIRVRSPLSPLSVYYDLEIKPPPIPGMRPPLGSPGGPVPAQKTSMGFVMPIYTICIIVFFVYTLSKILFKRTSAPYDPVLPDQEFRRRVFRDESRSSPEKLVVSAISGLVAEVRQQMESRAPGQQSQEALDSTRPYTNGTIIHNSGPVQIVTSEYQEIKDEPSGLQTEKELSPKLKESTPEPDNTIEPEECVEENIKEEKLDITAQDESTDLKPKDMVCPKDETDMIEELQAESTGAENAELDKLISENETEVGEKENLSQNNENVDLIKLSEEIQSHVTKAIIKSAEDFINEERKELKQEEKLTQELKQEDESTQEQKQEEESTHEQKQEEESTKELLEEAIREESPQDKGIDDKENQSVKVIGMETTEHPVDGGAWRAEPRVVPPQRPHESDQVQSIFLETEIPQQSRVLVTDFKDTPQPSRDSPLVVSGKITLSLIQDTRGTPDRDLESTQDDFTTASAATQPAEKDEELSDEEIEEEIEIEEIEEEVEEEVEEEEEEEPKKRSLK